MPAEFDEVDRKILELLQTDARTPLAAIGKAVGLSGPAISERVHKLEESGVILGYTTLLDPEKLGLPLTAFIRVMVDTGRDAADDADASMRALAADPDVLEIHHVAGEDCFILKVRAANPRGIETLLARLRGHIRSARTITMIVLSTIKEDGRLVRRREEWE